jgi:hypothetical protein
MYVSFFFLSLFLVSNVRVKIFVELDGRLFINPILMRLKEPGDYTRIFVFVSDFCFGGPLVGHRKPQASIRHQYPPKTPIP